MPGSIKIKNLQDAEFTLTHPDGAGAVSIASNKIANIDVVNAALGLKADKTYVDGLFGKDIYTGAYGLVWNEINDTYTRIGSPNYTAIQSMMKRCVVNAAGNVVYFLDAKDSTLKAEGGVADLTGASGNVMVQIPKVYVRYSNTSGVKSMEISLTADSGFVVHPAFTTDGVEKDFRYYRAYEGFVSGGKLLSVSGVTPTRTQTIATFRTQAVANGTGWHLTDWSLLHLVQTLCIIEAGTFNTQAVFGNGNDTGADYGITTGQSNSIGNGSSPSTNDNMWMSYRGIENFYGDIWEFIDGVNVQNRLVYTNNNPSSFASDVFTGSYTSIGVTMPTASAAYINDLNYSTKGFIPTAVTGSATTKVTDGLWTATGNTVVFFSGSAADGLLDGALCLATHIASSYSYAYLGASVSR